ncbi:MAG: hypothetical protein RL095_864 [Verrucomicrobiota bacterium]|jgi:mono/diheme cytochrome c family protein
MSRALLALLPAAGLALGGCRSLAEIAPPVQPTMRGDAAALSSGRQIYLNRCGSCHGLDAVDDHSPQAWAELLPAMNRKSKLSEVQAEQLRLYLLSAREWKIQQQQIQAEAKLPVHAGAG